MKTIDLRSDTVTRPTAGMRQAMLAAEVGDDVYGEDPTVCQLEESAASYFGTQAALFCVSGTMANQIALRLHTQPGDEVICHRLSHVYLYEGGGMAANALLSAKLLDGNFGRLQAHQIAENINPDDIHFPRTRLVVLENTVNRGGGCCYKAEDISAIHKLCGQYDLKLHLDGARLFNALIAQAIDPHFFGKHFDTLSVCLSKGLGCPVGSLLLGKQELIDRARRIRKLMGGGWRQAGMLAAAGLYALQHHVQRLAEDHHRARMLGQALQNHPHVEEVYPVETNIVIARLRAPYTAKWWQQYLMQHNIRISTFGEHSIRMVTHLDIDDEQLSFTLEHINRLAKSQVQHK